MNNIGRKRMPHGKKLTEEICNAMKRLESLGVRYPSGYCEKVLEKYNSENVPYPYIVMQIGNPRIKKHFYYGKAIKRQGDLLDYGCGTGDAIRQLIRDGYPTERINGFDVNDLSMRLGIDLYLDEEIMEKIVSVSPQFSCKAGVYDQIYSGSVIHVIKEEDEFSTYLMNAYQSLRPRGIFFGSTLGILDSLKERDIHGPPRLMRKSELENAFSAAGFSNIRIIEEERPEIERSDVNFCLYQFCAGK